MKTKFMTLILSLMLAFSSVSAQAPTDPDEIARTHAACAAINTVVATYQQDNVLVWEVLAAEARRHWEASGFDLDVIKTLTLALDERYQNDVFTWSEMLDSAENCAAL